MSGHRRSTRRLKATLAGLIVIGGVSCITVSGTYAVFTSQESHVTNKVTAGTLLLTDGVSASFTTTPTTTCNSYATGTTNANASCTSLISSSPLQYPGTTATTYLAMKDSGTIDGLTLSLYMPTCTSTTSPSSTGHTGGGLACQTITDNSVADGLQFVIQETNASNSPTYCWYPVAASGTCSAATGYSTALPNSFGNFAQHLTSTAHTLSLGSGPTAGTTRYFTVSVIMPTNASNSLQGEEALFGLTWHLAD
jgi:predicted ribosomally synthesized peptide with SipW-like signal peptide